MFIVEIIRNTKYAVLKKGRGFTVEPSGTY
jgi:hypothetical protein